MGSPSTRGLAPTMLQLCTIYACANGTLGLNLSRAPWDPYPWVSGVQAKSNAELGGVRLGDTLLELNGADVLGLRISELAGWLQEHWQSGAEHVTLMMWRQQASISPNEDPAEAAHAVHGINQQSLQKFATCLQHISQLLECPVCLEVIKPPGWQCCNGHVLCNNCRSRSVKCPVCRVPLGPRGRCLLSDKLFTLLAESFPCDGGKTSQVTAAQGYEKLSSVNKCTNEYHNQPKMALAKSNSGKKLGKSVLQAPEESMPKGPASGPPSNVAHESGGSRQGKEHCSLIKVQQNQPETFAEGHNNMLVKPKLKFGKKSWRIGGPDEDGLRCDGDATTNNGQRIAGEQVKSEFQNYHCPTGKSCSHKQQQPLANKLSTVALQLGHTVAGSRPGPEVVADTGALSAGSHKQAAAATSGVNQALDAVHREWQLLRHLSGEHRLAVVQFCGTFGQRLYVHPPPPQEGLVCLKMSEDLDSNLVHPFFLAVIPISSDTEYAVFLWHLDQAPLGGRSNFEAVIEAQGEGIKWFGPVQSLQRSWPEIRASGEFLCCRNLGATFEVTIKSR
ncbi:uncharacterized protein LOC110191141 isoform X2 [Drosophila serrata]|uniref:uncharacterized protein LOC110191141 isoform X2 n=1 Tax=Drosophila serrata TaxID=7274 RepID=UPI000A1D17EC|nr:uncharacterized protein LOC110191141 isoform X2 [Drosophila serrata]